MPVTSNIPSQAFVSLEDPFPSRYFLRTLMLFKSIFPTGLSFCKSMSFMANQQFLYLFYSNQNSLAAFSSTTIQCLHEILISDSSFNKSYEINKLFKVVQRSYDIWGGQGGLEEAREEKAEKREIQKQRKFDKKVKGELCCCCCCCCFTLPSLPLCQRAVCPLQAIQY